MNAHVEAFDERTAQVDLSGEPLPLVPRLSCEGRAGRRHPPMALSIARAAPLVLWCPRCEARFLVEELTVGGKTKRAQGEM